MPPVETSAKVARPRHIALTNVTVVDGTGAPAKPNMTVVITGTRISALGRTGRLRLPRGALKINAAGKFLIPGLWDMHVHLSYLTELALPVLVANGVTGVRDMGGSLEQIDGWRRDIEAGNIVGPRILRAGHVVDGPRAEEARYRLTVANPEEAGAAVRSLKRSGVDFIKVYHFLTREAYFAVALEAKRQNIPFAGHVPNGVSPVEASEAGQSSIEHIQTLIQSHIALADRRGRTQRELMDEALAAYAGETGDAVLRRFAINGTWHTPTLVVPRSSLLRPEVAARPDDRRKYVAASLKRYWEKYSPVPTAVSAEEMAYRRFVLQKLLDLVGAMHRRGVRLLAGTDPPTRDVLPGFSLHDELELLVRAGLTPSQALQTATQNPARFLGLIDETGTVERGKSADLVLLEADPLEDIRNTRRIDAVIVNGRYLAKGELQTMLDRVEAAANGK